MTILRKSSTHHQSARVSGRYVRALQLLPARHHQARRANRDAAPARQRKRGIQCAEKGTVEIGHGRTNALHQDRDPRLHRGLALRSRIKARVEEKTKFAGGRPVAGNFFLRRQEKITKKKATPVRCPLGCPVLLAKAAGCATRAARSNSARRLPPPRLFCSAAHRGIHRRKDQHTMTG